MAALASAQRVFSVHSAPERGEKRQSLDLAESSCQLALSPGWTPESSALCGAGSQKGS